MSQVIPQITWAIITKARESYLLMEDCGNDMSQEVKLAILLTTTSISMHMFNAAYKIKLIDLPNK
jgi:hypothetical protein